MADAGYFFEEVLPKLARGKAAAFPALAVRASIAVDNRAWTLDLHNEQNPVRPGGDPEAAFQLWLSGQAFGQLMDGQFDVEAAVAARAVGVRGDVRYLAQLGNLLAGPGRVPAVRGGAR